MAEILITLMILFIKVYLFFSVLRGFELYGSGWTWKEILMRFDNHLLFTNMTKEKYNETFTIQETKR